MKKPNWKLTEACGGKFYTGKGGGLIVFWPDNIKVKWDKAASVAPTDPKKGTAKRTRSQGSKLPPEYDRRFMIATSARYNGNLESPDGTWPLEPTPEQFERWVSHPVMKYAWRLFHAMASGDFEELQRFTDATRLAATKAEHGGIYDEIEESIYRAARAAGEPPTKKAVFKVWKAGQSENQLGSKMDLIPELCRMGFGWLPNGVRGPADH